MAKSFTSVGRLGIQFASHNLSNDYKYSCKFGSLIPVCVRECVPGDKIKYDVSAIVRLNPTVAPVLHKMDIRFEAFFCPNRIIDDNWESIITGGQDGQDTHLPPIYDFIYKNESFNPQKTLWDFLGFPINTDSSGDYIPFSKSAYLTLSTEKKRSVTPVSYPFRAYYKIWNDFYRDENIQNELGIVDNQLYVIQSRNWTKNDYFTSALPFIQRGVAPSMSLNLSGIPLDLTNGDITFGSPDTVNYESSSSSKVIGVSRDMQAGYQGSSTFGTIVNQPYMTGTSGNPFFQDDTSLSGKKLYFYSDSQVEGGGSDYDHVRHFTPLKSNVSGTTGDGGSFSINASDIRWLMQTQKFLERNARAGYRYNEQVLAHFGIYIGDYRVQRPEFLGATKSPIIVSEVPQTSASNNVSSQGNLAGKGLGAVQSSLVRYRCKEHGYFIVLASIVPKLSYNSQGLHKSWIKKSKYSYYFPEFSHLTEQAIHNSELYFPADFDFENGAGSETFGYTGIYNEYRSIPDMTAGDMRDKFDYWHLNRKFDSMPALNDQFISIYSSNDSLARVFAVQDEDFFLVDVYNKCIMWRPIPALAEPGLVDHF